MPATLVRGIQRSSGDALWEVECERSVCGVINDCTRLRFIMEHCLQCAGGSSPMLSGPALLIREHLLRGLRLLDATARSGPFMSRMLR